MNLIPGQKVILKRTSFSFVNIPKEDQDSIKAIIGKPIEFVEYDSYGRAELRFFDVNGDEHTIWVDPKEIMGLFIK